MRNQIPEQNCLDWFANNVQAIRTYPMRSILFVPITFKQKKKLKLKKTKNFIFEKKKTKFFAAAAPPVIEIFYNKFICELFIGKIVDNFCYNRTTTR